jgi:hypothetical protein
VWRLVKETLGLDVVMVGPSDEVCIQSQGLDAYYNDELTEDELQVICGVYKVYTGTWHCLTACAGPHIYF